MPKRRSTCEHERERQTVDRKLCGQLLTLGLVATGANSAAATVSPHTSSDDRLTIDGMSSSELVLRVGLVDSYWQADSPANVSVYADGRVVAVDADERLGYATFVVDSGTIDALLRLAAETTLFDEVDYGDVMVTDVGSTASRCTATKATRWSPCGRSNTTTG